MFAMPRNQGFVSGTGVIGGTGITSPASARSTSQLWVPTCIPSLDAATPRPALRRRSARSRWYSLSEVRAKRLSQRLDLGEQVVLARRLHDVVARALPHSPDLVGLLTLRGAHDHRDVLGAVVLRQRAGRLVAVLSGHHHVH